MQRTLRMWTQMGLELPAAGMAERETLPPTQAHMQRLVQAVVVTVQRSVKRQPLTAER